MSTLPQTGYINLVRVFNIPGPPMVWKMNEYLLHKFNSDNINKSILIFKLQSSAYTHFCCYSWYQSEKLSKVLKAVGGFPGGATGKERACQGRRCKRRGWDPWVGKIPWRRAWQPTPVFLPEEFPCKEKTPTVHGVTNSQTWLSD